MKPSGTIITLMAVTVAFTASMVMFQRVIPATSPSFVVLLMFVFMGWIAFARPLFVLPLPPPVRKLRAWENNCKLYRSVGAVWFGRILRNTPLRLFHPLVYLGHGKLAADAVNKQIEGAEAVHWWSIALTVPYMIYSAALHRLDVFGAFAVMHLGLHVYPIMHLRHTRARMCHFLERRAVSQPRR